jgi:uncharacterized OB-fold protein
MSVSVARCTDCQTRYLPRPGPCPKCGSRRSRPENLDPHGVVLAATELTVPPPGFPATHRLGLVELGEGVRVLVVVRGDLPNVGEQLIVERDGDLYVARRAGSA